MQVMIGEAAKMVGVHPSTLRRWIRWGKMHPVPRNRNGWRVFRDEDIEILRSLAHPRNGRTRV